MILPPPPFADLVNDRIRAVDSCVCLGLDPDLEKLPQLPIIDPAERVLAFNKALIERAYHILLAIKLNAAFYARLGPSGIRVIKETFDFCRDVAPNVIRILDYKRADIGNTNRGYVAEARYCGANAVTVLPYFGQESLEPFLSQRDLGVIVVCRTSNPGAQLMQDGTYTPPDAKTEKVRYKGFPNFPISYHQFVAHNVHKHWNTNKNCALVVGATFPTQLIAIRRIIGDDMPLLIPGFGAQGGTAADVALGLDKTKGGAIANNSRGLMLAFQNKQFLEKHPEFVGCEEKFAEATCVAATEMRDAINKFRTAS